ncbi:myxosortase MrtX [Vulgatibacter incomptus]|uniref:CAAX amino terminal protease family protein n=1 Tax=Vulgatibacter incomptus TaxID=1391653 RepID=A0A0K1PAV6_9BACT|nr:MXAN_2755 family glutamic-type intramembrane protease [Vulgatibacter incomptus]AKU90673.1 CAAX amino terminal protease family protein [Vulgatibacter incomptus]
MAGPSLELDPNEPRADRPSPRAAIVREAVGIWALAFAGLVAAKVGGLFVPFVGGQVKAVAAGLFLYLPGVALRRRGETVDEYGIPDWPWRSPASWRQFRRDLAWGAGVCLALLVPVVAGFLLILQIVPHLPEAIRELVVPYAGGGTGFSFRFPERMWLHVLDQVLVVALAEEFFYRGYLQTRLVHAFGKGSLRLLGVQVGAAFWLTQLLFAVGHLGELHPWRLSVFFPAILFGWLRERTGSIGAGVIVHAFSNLLLMTLEASAFG